MGSIFSGKRFGHLLRYEFAGEWSTMPIAGGAVAGVLLIINVASCGSANQWDIHSIFYPLTLLIGGYFYASYSFAVLGDRLQAAGYLVLPASMFEKYLGKFLLSTVGIVVYITAGYFLVSLAATGITSAAFGVAHPIFDPLSGKYLSFLQLFIVNHSVLFFGSVYFRRHALVKTILSIFVLSLALSLLSVILMRIIYFDHFRGLTFEPRSGYEHGIIFGDGVGSDSQDAVVAFLKRVLELLKFLFCWVMAPFFWILGFIRLRETEA